LSLSVSLPSGAGGRAGQEDDDTDASEDEVYQRRVALDSSDEESWSAARRNSKVHPIDDGSLPHSSLAVGSERSFELNVAAGPNTDAAVVVSEKHEFEDAEKSFSADAMPPQNPGREEDALGLSVDDIEITSPEDIDPSPFEANMRAGQGTADSGIDRDAGTQSRSSQPSSSTGRGGRDAKLWSSFKKHVRRIGGSTGSLSSPSPTSEDPQLAQTTAASSSTLPRSHSGGSSGGGGVYSPEVANMESPKEGGFGHGELPQSAALLKKHIKELYSQLAKSEGDKQKIADQAYRRAMDIKAELEAQLDDAKVAQEHQVNLVQRLRVK